MYECVYVCMCSRSTPNVTVHIFDIIEQIWLPQNHYSTWAYRPKICTYMQAKIQATTIPTSQVIAMYRPVKRCLSTSQIYELVHAQIRNKYVSINTLYELIKSNNVTRNTGIQTFHIFTICPCTDMPTTLHIYVPLHYHCSLYINCTYKIEKKNCNFSLPCYFQICANKKYIPQMPNITLCYAGVITLQYAITLLYYNVIKLV